MLFGNRNLQQYWVSGGLLGAVAMWSSDYVGVREALHSFSPGALALLRYLIASSFMFVIYWCLPQHTPLKLRQIPRVYLLGAFGIAGYNIGLNFGEVLVPSGIASFIVSQMPLIMAIMGFLFLKERLSKLTLLGLLAGVTGILLIALSGHQQVHFELGLAYLALATLGACIYSVLQKPYLSQFSAVEFTCFIIWAGTFTMLGYLPELLRELLHATLKDLEVILYLGLFPSAVAYIIWAYAIAKMPVSKAGAYLYLSPLITTLLARFSLGEMPNHMALLGGTVALLGAILVGFSPQVTQS